MVIDFHTHIFPDKIAGKTIEKLEQAADVKAYTNGTYDGLLESMNNSENMVDMSVVLPVVTKVSQFKTVNEYASSITEKNGIISFGGIHPDSENYKAEVEEIKRLGLLGIKLHPDYQNTFIDDEKYIKIIQYAMDLDLIVSIHAGEDIGLPEVVHCTPERARKMLDKINSKNKKIVLAHTGGFRCWDDVEKYIVGQDVYIDISFSFGYIDDEQFVRIIKNHGFDKVLFATDSPWSGQKESIEYLKKLSKKYDISEEDLEKIFYKNALELLKK